MRLKLAVQLYTLRNFMNSPESIEQALRKVKAIGYNAVQQSGPIAVSNEEFKRLADEIGLTICATHGKFDDLQNRMDDVVAKHKLWECRYVGLGSLPPEYRTGKEGYERFAELASGMGRKLREAGLTFIYHNHDWEFARFGDATGMEILYERFDPETVQFELDVHWIQAGGGDPIEWIRKVKGRMGVVHLKDMTLTPERERRFAAVGAGNMNMRGIVEACLETGVEWGAVEQDESYGRDPFEELEISFHNLVKMGADA